jgi:hypothetical protein
MGMAITEDDAGLVEELLALLHAHGAGWVAAEVEAERAAPGVQRDPTREAEMLLVAIARSLGVVPGILLDANLALSDVLADPSERQAAPIGVVLGESEISFAEAQRLRNLAEAAERLHQPVDHILYGPIDDG